VAAADVDRGVVLACPSASSGIRRCLQTQQTKHSRMHHSRFLPSSHLLSSHVTAGVLTELNCTCDGRCVGLGRCVGVRASSDGQQRYGDRTVLHITASEEGLGDRRNAFRRTVWWLLLQNIALARSHVRTRTRITSAFPSRLPSSLATCNVSRCALCLGDVRLLDDECTVLKCLGAHVPFELAIGANGQVWIKSGSPMHTVLISNAILVPSHLISTASPLPGL
jgi:hypothetical protein